MRDLGSPTGYGDCKGSGYAEHQIYNADPPHHWYLQWSAVLFVVVGLGGGFTYYWFKQRRHVGVLDEHRSMTESAVNDAEPATS